MPAGDAWPESRSREHAFAVALLRRQYHVFRLLTGRRRLDLRRWSAGCALQDHAAALIGVVRRRGVWATIDRDLGCLASLGCGLRRSRSMGQQRKNSKKREAHVRSHDASFTRHHWAVFTPAHHAYLNVRTPRSHIHGRQGG